MIKLKLNKSKKDPEVYFYIGKDKEKLWMYRHKYYDDSGKRKEKKKSSFKSEKEAIKALLEVKSETIKGNTRQVQYDRMTVSEWIDIWYETYSKDWEITTRVQRKKSIDKQIKPRIGKYTLQKLDRTTYKRVFINGLLKTHKPSSVQWHHNVFMGVVNAAVDDEILSHNKFKKMGIEKDEILENFLTPEELSIFLETSKKRNNITAHSMILLLAFTGLRQGEAFGLNWGNIDLKKKTITVDCTRDNHGLRTPKTKNSYRTIKVDDLIIDQLLAYQKWCLETKFQYGMKLDKKNDYVFISNQSGAPCSYMVLQHAFKSIYKQLDKDEIKINHITPHGLRHTHATILINNGTPPKTVAKRLGNNVDMIYKVYSHSTQEVEEIAVSAFTNRLFGAKTGAN
ncbi:tyrosine-type recombinase/integrase [Oceanobacillus jordanicus]|uniref:Site-specific integrase n=1 Tax=Oceanobacillus jordanicus TaxID=2867266 RepID=A0AAW5B612_9BACI|nr:site-specific integrase [Oceanobacillus jordanicus]MCG3418998.1 site-specific integrase [Oceanobacillus jordanicus]